MAMELIYTSVKNGLKPGSVGFCTVAMSRNMPAGLAAALESLSGYRHIFAAGDNRYAENPVNFGHLLLADRSRLLRVLLRISSAPADYTGRTNKLAHFIVLDPGEYASAGPAWLLQQPGLMRDAWTGEPRWLEQPPAIPMGSSVPTRCTAWERITGDAGWAGELLTRFADRPDDPVHLVCNPDTPMLDLFAEALALLPPQSRWQIAFSTYFTGLSVTGAKCHWRGLMAGPGESKLDPKSVINLTQPLGRAPDGPAFEAARTGTMMAPAAPVIAEAPIKLVDTSGRSAPPKPAAPQGRHPTGMGMYDLATEETPAGGTGPFNPHDLEASGETSTQNRRRWLWPAIFGAAALLVLVVFLAIFFVKEIRSMRRQAGEQRRLLAVTSPSTPAKSKPPARPAVNKSPPGQQKAPKKNHRTPKPGKKPAPVKPGPTAAEVQKAKARAASIAAAAKAKAAAAAKAKVVEKKLAAEQAAESHMEQKPITILNHPIFGAAAASGFSLVTSSKKVATVQKVKAFMVVFPPKIKGGTLSLVAAGKKEKSGADKKWNAGQWYPAKGANQAIMWRSSSSAGLGGVVPIHVAKITISASGALRVSCAPKYFGQHRAKRRAVEGTVVDVLRKGNKIERIQFLPSPPVQKEKVVALNNNTPSLLSVTGPTGWIKTAVVVVESFDPGTAKLRLKVNPPHVNSPASVVVALPPITKSGAVKQDWNRVVDDMRTQGADFHKPSIFHRPPPLRFWLVKTGMRNRYAGMLKKLNALAAQSEPWLSQIKSSLAGYCITKSQQQELKLLQKKGSKKNTAMLKRLKARKRLTSDLLKLEKDYQKREQRIKTWLAALRSLKRVRLRVEFYPGGPVLLQVTYQKEIAQKK